MFTNNFIKYATTILGNNQEKVGTTYPSFLAKSLTKFRFFSPQEHQATLPVFIKSYVDLIFIQQAEEVLVSRENRSDIRKYEI